MSLTTVARVVVPRPLIIGYCHDAHATDQIDAAIRSGVNVIIWSFVHLALDEDDGIPTLHTDLDLDAIRRVRARHDDVLHLAAFGGWNGPHPPNEALTTGEEWCRVFLVWNEDGLFDGVDWDLEGHDDRLHAPTRRFTRHTLDVVADFSREAKRHGLLVSLAPAESYLDALSESSSSFSYDLNFFPPVWDDHDADRAIIDAAGFAHAGRQCYAYLLRDQARVDDYDWIAVQYYESYSRFVHDTTRRRVRQADALVARARAMDRGFRVTGLPSEEDGGDDDDGVLVRIPYEKIVFGFANGWASPTKNAIIDPDAVREACDTLSTTTNRRLGGVMFWTIEEEGTNNVHLASSLTRAMVRDGGNNEQDDDGDDSPTDQEQKQEL